MTGIHIEPFGVQSKIRGKILEIQVDLIQGRGWNLTFFDVLYSSERRKVLDVNCVTEEILCSGIDPSLHCPEICALLFGYGFKLSSIV